MTEKCNLNCFYCHREGVYGEYADGNEELNKDILTECIKIMIKCGIMKVKFMGGEPTVYHGLSDIIRELKSESPQVGISVITNGSVSGSIFDEYIKAGIDRINISLHGFIPSVFSQVTNGTEKQLKKTLDNIEYLNTRKILGKVNYVLLKGKNEEEFWQVMNYIQKKNLVLDILNYLGTDEEELLRYYYSFDEIMNLVNSRYKIQSVEEKINQYSINSLRVKLEGGGSLNLKINQLNRYEFLKSCSKCEKRIYCREGIAAIRLTNRGIIKPCLFREDNCFDLVGYLKNHSFDAVYSAVNEYLNNL